MHEIILKSGETNPFANDANAKQIGAPVAHKIGTDEYTKITYSTDVSFLSRTVAIIKGLAATVLTLFIGLFFQRVRDYWIEGFTGKSYTAILTPTADFTIIFKFGPVTVTIEIGDITKQKCDAIVTAAKPSLLDISGANGALHLAAGETVSEELKKLPEIEKDIRCKVGDAVTTGAGNLSAKHIIHVVSPEWNDAKDSEVALQTCYINCLAEARKLDLQSIVFPSIRTEKFPSDKAAVVAIDTISKFGKSTSKPLDVKFVLFNEKNFKTYQAALTAATK